MRRCAAAFGALSACLLGLPGTAWAGSQTRPGFTTGVAVYQLVPDGLYTTVIEHIGSRDTAPESHSFAVTPYFYLQTPLTVAAGRIGVAVAPTYLDSDNRGRRTSGIYNIYVAAQLLWKLSGSLGAGVRLGGYIPQEGPAANRFGSIEARTGLSYAHGGTSLTANLEYGVPQDDPAAGHRTAPDYVNLDLTATRKRGRVQLGLVAFASLDVSRPTPAYRRQRQAALGPLVGYDFGRFAVQLKATTDVAQRNYGGIERRLWLNISAPLWRPTPRS